MSNSARSFVGLLILASLLAGCGGTGSAVNRGIGEGNLAPNFTLETIEGQNVSLEDYRGSIVLINFWASWCGPCRAEVPALEAAYRARQQDGLVVLGVNFQESPEEARAFAQSMDVTYPILLDESGQVMKVFRAVGLPLSILVDREGVIQVRHSGLLTGADLDGYLAHLLP